MIEPQASYIHGFGSNVESIFLTLNRFELNCTKRYLAKRKDTFIIGVFVAFETGVYF